MSWGIIASKFFTRAGLSRPIRFNPIKSVFRNCTFRRAMLYVPGTDKKKIEKALMLSLDCIALDFEDGVAQNNKDEAREVVHMFLNDGNVTKSDPEWCVRINSVYTGDVFLKDLEVILSAKQLPAAIALPKVDSTEHLRLFAEETWKILIKRPENDRGPINLIMFVESARAVMNLPEICQKAQELSTMAPVVPVALVFGSDDLSANIGSVRTHHTVGLMYARQKIVLVAKAFGLQAIDMVNTNLQATENFKNECMDGVLMGYTGKQVIHPIQVPIAQDLFSPSRTRVKWATNIVKEFEKNQMEGKGAFAFEGNMIDMPTVRQAQEILKTAEAIRKLQGDSNKS